MIYDCMIVTCDRCVTFCDIMLHSNSKSKKNENENKKKKEI